MNHDIENMKVTCVLLQTSEGYHDFVPQIAIKYRLPRIHMVQVRHYLENNSKME